MATILCLVFSLPALSEQSSDANEGPGSDKPLASIIPPRNRLLSIYWENDGTLIKPNHRTDRHYTNGLKLVFAHQPDWDWLKSFASWNDFGKGGEVKTAMGYFLGQNIYTPDNVDKPEKRTRPDMVFAGWMYGGIFAQRSAKNEMEHFELNLGVIGQSALGDESQTFIHKVVGQDKPEGWDEQLDDEFAIDFTWLKKHRADGLPFRHTEIFDSFLEYGFTAGSVHRNADVGLIMRLGKNLPNDFGPGRLEAPYCATGTIGDKQTYYYLFGRATAKFVEHNRFLTGLDTRPVVGQFQVGAVWRHKSLELSYSQTFLTDEFEEQSGHDSFASLFLSYYF